MSPDETVNAALKRGAVEEVSDEGQVTLRLPTGRCEVVQIPLEQVVRVRLRTGCASKPRRAF